MATKVRLKSLIKVSCKTRETFFRTIICTYNYPYTLYKDNVSAEIILRWDIEEKFPKALAFDRVDQEPYTIGLKGVYRTKHLFVYHHIAHGPLTNTIDPVHSWTNPREPCRT